MVRYLLGLFALLLLGCSNDAATGPEAVHWDRDTCTRCNMVLSDRLHAVEVRRAASADRAGALYKFDDFGCAVLWLDRQRWRDEPGVELWVVDHRNGDWIAARDAFYLQGRQTPMQYGLSAQAEAAPGALSFDQAREAINRVESTHNNHGGGHQHADRVAVPSIQ